MHSYLERVQRATERDARLKDLLGSNPGTPSDVGAGIVTGLGYTGLGRIVASSDAPFIAAEPDREGARTAAAHFGERITQPTLLDAIRYAPQIVARRPYCEINAAIGLLGWMAANDPALAYERSERFGDTASQEAGTLAQKLKDHQLFSSLHLTLDSASYCGAELDFRDFRTDARNHRDDKEHESAVQSQKKDARLREVWRQREENAQARRIRSHVAFLGD